jgi:hypothetical protein
MLTTAIEYSIGIPTWNNKLRERNKMDSKREERTQNIPTCK